MVEAWYMDESREDQRAPHRLRPNRAVSLEQLRRLGVAYRKLDADNYETDPCLKEIRRAENYSWMDIVTIHKDKLPNYEEKVTFKGFKDSFHDGVISKLIPTSRTPPMLICLQRASLG